MFEILHGVLKKEIIVDYIVKRLVLSTNEVVDNHRYVIYAGKKELMRLIKATSSP
jgi:hypothetical protein